MLLCAFMGMNRGAARRIKQAGERERAKGKTQSSQADLLFATTRTQEEMRKASHARITSLLE